MFLVCTTSLAWKCWATGVNRKQQDVCGFHQVVFEASLNTAENKANSRLSYWIEKAYIIKCADRKWFVSLPPGFFSKTHRTLKEKKNLINKKCKISNSIQDGAARCSLEIHKFAPLSAVRGDMGWIRASVRRKWETAGLWNFLLICRKIGEIRKLFAGPLRLMLYLMKWSCNISYVLLSMNTMKRNLEVDVTAKLLRRRRDKELYFHIPWFLDDLDVGRYKNIQVCDRLVWTTWWEV